MKAHFEKEPHFRNESSLWNPFWKWKQVFRKVKSIFFSDQTFGSTNSVRNLCLLDIHYGVYKKCIAYMHERRHLVNFSHLRPLLHLGDSFWYYCQSYTSQVCTINIWKKVLTKAIWADKKWAGFRQISLYIK